MFPCFEDTRPKTSRTITDAHLRNRLNVYCGKVIEWSEHGRVAIVRDELGDEAAFWHFELIESPSSKAKYPCAGCKGLFDHSELCPSNEGYADYLYCRDCDPRSLSLVIKKSNCSDQKEGVVE